MSLPIKPELQRTCKSAMQFYHHDYEQLSEFLISKILSYTSASLLSSDQRNLPQVAVKP